MSGTEVAEMDRRMDIQERLTPMIEYARRWPDTFGGLYVDQAHGGIVDFAFTANVETHEAALRALTPPGAEVRVREVALAEIDLDALVDTVSRDVDFQESRVGITVHNVRTNTAENAVEVFIEPYALEGASLLVARYGSAVRILPGTAPKLTACTNRDSCDGPPIMAGVSNDWGCTVGFGVWMDGYRRFLTAGHCVQQTDDKYGRGGWTWWHHVTNLGVSTDESWFDYSPADAGSMGNISSTIHSDRVLSNNTGSWHEMRSPQSASNDYAGYLICQSGQTSGFRCGKILTRNATPNYDGVRLK